MEGDPFSGMGLRPVELADRAVMEPYFQSLAEPLSDYTFPQIYSWRNSLRIVWKIIEGHLCVFANGTGDLTLLLPPIGETGSDRALRGAFEMMDIYNAAAGAPERSRVEYVSEELLSRLDCAKLVTKPLGMDYVYDVNRMIDLGGGDLASKRQAKNRFLRKYRFRVEPYVAEKHLEECKTLLTKWKQHQDRQHEDEARIDSVKRQKESLATELSLHWAEELNFCGIVVYVEENGEEGIRGFTLGEELGRDQSSIVIEKTDLGVKGLAQFIFSDFCERYWSHRPLVNVGDDWGLESLAWTKMSYRPVKLLRKFALERAARPSVVVSVGGKKARQTSNL